MPIYGRHFEPRRLQFITTSSYRRSPLIDCDRFRCYFADVLRELRPDTDFLMIGYMHHSPVKRRLVSCPDQWSWSSFGFYDLSNSSVLTMDRLV